MSIEKIARSLPNGFHDSKMKAISIDYLGKEIKIQLDILVDMNAGFQSRYKSAELTIKDFAFCVVDAPNEKYPYLKNEGLTIDIGSGQPSTSEIKLPPYEKTRSLIWIWVEEWNGFFRIAAKDFELN